MPIQFLLVKTCCCWNDLASGAKFFGFLSLTGSILLLIIGTYELASMSRWLKYYDNMLWEEILFISLDIFTQIVQASTATLLLLGVYQRKAKLMTYWLFTTPVVAILEFTILSNVTLQIFYVRHFTLEWFILNSATMFDDIYGWLVVYSYYYSVEQPQQQPSAL